MPEHTRSGSPFFFILGGPVAVIVLLLGTTVWFVHAVRQIRASECRTADRTLVLLASPVLLVAALAAAWPMMALGNYIGGMSRLLINLSAYEAIIERERTNAGGEPFGQDGSVYYLVDRGPPLRVAFNPDGLLDNWAGVVYDPTGDVMLADGFDPVTGQFFAPERITKLFGGDLVSCRRLLGEYYACSFT